MHILRSIIFRSGPAKRAARACPHRWLAFGTHCRRRISALDHYNCAAAPSTRVLLVVGGNDVASKPFIPRVIMELFRELALGIVAAGAAQPHVLPIPTRVVCR